MTVRAPPRGYWLIGALSSSTVTVGTTAGAGTVSVSIDAGGIGLLSAATETWTMRDITAGGSPLWIASTYCVPDSTRPNTVQRRSTEKPGWSMMKNWQFGQCSHSGPASAHVLRQVGQKRGGEGKSEAGIGN